MSASLRKFGFELEYASGAEAMVRTLHDAGLMRTDTLHDYHCRCSDCAFVAGPTEFRPVPYDDHECDSHCRDYGCWNDSFHRCGRPNCPQRRGSRVAEPADLRAQRDSTANGEFITRPIEDWDDFARIVTALTTAASEAGAGVNSRCGLHVHVDTSSDMNGGRNEYDEASALPLRQQRRVTTPAAYLAYERYFTEIVAPGNSIRKREMNSTLMQAVRQYVVDGYARGNPEQWMDMGRNEVDTLLSQTIGRDRHVDLNWSRNHGTWEFRSFNATNAPWRIELACRLSVAFVEATPALRSAIESQVRGSKYWPEGCDSPWGEIIRPAFTTLPAPHPTKKPVVPIAEFIDILCAVDPDLRPLIERQAAYMRSRYATQVEVAV